MRRILSAVVIGLPVALAGIPTVPLRLLEQLPQVCLFRRVFGTPCRGCGMTRAIWHLLRGEWDAAVAYHPWAPGLLVAVCAAWVGALVWLLVRSGRLPSPELRRGLMALWLALAGATATLTVAFALAPAGAAGFASRLAHPHDRACALCGLTRSFSHVARGRLSDAFTAHPAGPFLYVLLAANQMAAAVCLVRRRRRSGHVVAVGVACKCSA